MMLNILKWIIDPFEADLFEINVNLQETFSDLQNDFELKVNFSKESLYLKSFDSTKTNIGKAYLKKKR